LIIIDTVNGAGMAIGPMGFDQLEASPTTPVTTMLYGIDNRPEAAEPTC